MDLKENYQNSQVLRMLFPITFLVVSSGRLRGGQVDENSAGAHRCKRKVRPSS